MLVSRRVLPNQCRFPYPNQFSISPTSAQKKQDNTWNRSCSIWSHSWKLRSKVNLKQQVVLKHGKILHLQMGKGGSALQLRFIFQPCAIWACHEHQWWWACGQGLCRSTLQLSASKGWPKTPSLDRPERWAPQSLQESDVLIDDMYIYIYLL